MTFFYVWHDSFLPVAYSCVRAPKRQSTSPSNIIFYIIILLFFIHEELDHSILLWAYACVCVCHTWHIPICTTTHFDVWHDSSIRKYHFYVWHDSFLPWAYSCVWVTWRIPICTTAHFYVWHDLSTRNGRIRELSHGSFIGSHSHLHVRARSISMCDMTPLQGTDNFAAALSHGSFRSTYSYMYLVISTRLCAVHWRGGGLGWVPFSRI